MSDQNSEYVKRDDFLALCEQVARLAAELEDRELLADPDGPNGWRLRTTTEIKERVREIAAASSGLKPASASPRNDSDLDDE